MAALTYNPDVFRVPDEGAARRIILTPAGVGTDARWERETPYLVDLLAEPLSLRPGCLVVDYGCGIGRMAKALIERFNCIVIGVDISADMRRLAPGYVQSENFSAVSAPAFEAMVEAGFRADAALAVWVIQHSLAPAKELDRIRQGLRTGGTFGLVNNITRAVPTKEKPWANDGVDVRAATEERFTHIGGGKLDAAVVGDLVAEHSFWGAFRRD